MRSVTISRPAKRSGCLTLEVVSRRFEAPPERLYNLAHERTICEVGERFGLDHQEAPEEDAQAQAQEAAQEDPLAAPATEVAAAFPLGRTRPPPWLQSFPIPARRLPAVLLVVAAVACSNTPKPISND